MSEPQLCPECGAFMEAGQCPKCGLVMKSPETLKIEARRHQIKQIRDLSDSGFKATLLGRETFPPIVDVYGLIVKDDEVAVKQSFQHMLSAYTTEPSNLQTIAPTSEGKTYILVTVSSTFPDKDVWSLGGMSPTAIRHQRGELVDRFTLEPLDQLINDLENALDEVDEIEDKTERKKEKRRLKNELRDTWGRAAHLIDLENMVILFLDAPHPATQELFKPILSHDKRRIEHQVTESEGKGHFVKYIIIQGWPQVCVASTRVAAYDKSRDEIISRYNTVSPNMTPAKYRAAVELTALKKGVPTQLLQEKLHLDRFDWLRKVVQELKYELCVIKLQHENDSEVVISNIFWVPFHVQLGKALPAKVGKHMRDGTRFFTALQMGAAANLFNRPRLIIDGVPSVIVTRWDYEEAWGLYFEGTRGESILSGLSEKQLRFYYEVFCMCWEDRISQCEGTKPGKGQQALATGAADEPDIWVTTEQLTEKTKTAWETQLSGDSTRKLYLDDLEKSNYLTKEAHPVDGRKNHYRPLITKNAGKYGDLRDSHIFGLETLKEALDEFEILKEKELELRIEDYDGTQLTVEALYEKYFCEKPQVHSHIFSGENMVSLPEINPEIRDSRNIPDIPESSEEELGEGGSSVLRAQDDNPNIQHLKRVSEAQLKRAGYMTRADFFNFMYEAKHQDQNVILNVLKEDKRIEITDKGFRWVEEAES